MMIVRKEITEMAKITIQWIGVEYPDPSNNPLLTELQILVLGGVGRPGIQTARLLETKTIVIEFDPDIASEEDAIKAATKNLPKTTDEFGNQLGTIVITTEGVKQNIILD